MTLLQLGGNPVACPPLDTPTFLIDELARASATGKSLSNFLRFRAPTTDSLIEFQAIPSPFNLREGTWALLTSDLSSLPRLLNPAQLPFEPMGIFVIANALAPEVAARVQKDRWYRIPKGGGTTDADIVRRQTILFDFDPARRKHISATNDERAVAWQAATGFLRDVSGILGVERSRALGLGDSGNGYHAPLAVSLPADDDSSALVKAILTAAGFIYDMKGVHLDRAVSDPKRLCPAYGTMKRKGISTEDRPHRQTAFACHDDIYRATRPDLEELLSAFRLGLDAEQSAEVDAVLHNQKGRRGIGVKSAKEGGGAPRKSADERRRSDESPFAAANAVPIDEVASWQGVVDADGVVRCPGCDSTDGVGLHENGLKCFHDRCTDRGRNGFRTVVDLVAEVEGVSPVEAVNLIAAKFGTTALGSNSADSANSATDGWQLPMPFNGTGDLPSFPVDELPPVLRSWVAAQAEATQTPADLPAMMALGVLSAAAAKKVYVEVRAGWKEPVNLYLVTALPPGTRKTPVTMAAKRPIVEYERIALKAEQRADGEKVAVRRGLELDLAQVKKEMLRNSNDGEHRAEYIRLSKALDDAAVTRSHRILADDVTPEKAGMLLQEHRGRLAVISAEGGLFDTFGGRYSEVPNLDLILKAHAGEDVRVDRVNRGPVHIRQPALTLALGVQPEVVQGLADKPGFRARGLLARVLYSLPANLLGRRSTTPSPVPAEVDAAYDALVESFLAMAVDEQDGEFVAKRMGLDDGATRNLHNFENELEPKLGPGGDLESIADWASKLVGAIARIACLMQLVHDEGENRGVIREPAMTTAIALGAYFTEHAKRAFALMQTDPKEADAQHILRWLLTAQVAEFSKRDAFEKVKGRFKNIPALESVLDVLIERGYVRKKQETSARGRGRPPSERYIVNPLWASQNSRNSQ